MKKYFTLIIVFMSLRVLAQGPETEKHPIEIQFEECMGGSTQEMVECAYAEHDAWDKEMNKYYDLLKGVLSANEFKRLKAAQKKWLEYRDEEKKFYGKMYSDKEGTMWRVVSASRYKDIAKKRALELIEYYEMYNY